MTKPECTGDWMTCHVDNDHRSDCAWHPANVTVTYVSEEVWRDITEDLDPTPADVEADQ